MYENKLKRKDQFAYVFKSGKFLSLDTIVIQYSKRKEKFISANPRFGFIASKKVGNAVKRNFAKRRLKALEKIILSYGCKKLDYVFVAKKKILSESFSKISIDLKKGLKKTYKQL